MEQSKQHLPKEDLEKVHVEHESSEPEIEVLNAAPSLLDQEEEWKTWIKDEKLRWTRAPRDLQTARQVETKSAVKKMIEKIRGLLITAPGEVQDKVLGRSSGKVTLDRIQVNENDVTANIDESTDSKRQQGHDLS